MLQASGAESQPFQHHVCNITGTFDSLIMVNGNDFQKLDGEETNLKAGVTPVCLLRPSHLLAPSSPALLDRMPVPTPARSPSIPDLH